MTYTRTGDMKMAAGLVDYLADGYIERDGDQIPCQIGYNEYEDADGEVTCKAEYIFIKEGVTEYGTHYYADTIAL